MTDILDGLAKPPPPLSELDELMARDPLNLSAQDIDAIIAYQRQARARREAGGKTKRTASDAPKQSLDLAALGLIKKPQAPPKPDSVPGVVRSFRRI